MWREIAELEIIKHLPEELREKLYEIHRAAEPILDKIKDTFPEYTIHDIRHSNKVISILDWLIPEELKRAMNDMEIFFLLAAAILHDIGMIRLRDDETKEIIRKNHHIRSEKYIERHFKELRLDDHHQARIIGRICRGHREYPDDREKYDPREKYKEYNINVPLLVMLLQIADDLDLDFERVPLEYYKEIAPLDPISEQEWKKHQFTSGVSRAPDGSSRIEVKVVCESPKVHRALKLTERKIQDKLDKLPDYLFHYSKYARYLPLRIVFNIKQRGYKTHDTKFVLCEKKIIDMLTRRLYKRKDVFIRELLKNAVDACRMRRALLKKRGMSFEPQISFELNNGKLIVSDNGVGMNLEVVKKHFTRIGESFYKSREFEEMDLDFTPVSEFGIGVLTYFLASDKVIIETKTEKDEPLYIEAYGADDYLFVRKGKRKDVGTTVILYLKNEMKELNLEEAVRYYARHIEIPIKVKVGGEEVTILDEGYNLPIDKLNRGWRKERYYVHTFEIKEDDFDGRFGIALSKSDKLGYIPTEIYDIEPWEGRIALSFGGIFIGYLDVLKDIISGVHPYEKCICGDLNIKRRIVDIDASGTTIQENYRYEAFKERLAEHIFKAFKELFEDIKNKCPSTYWVSIGSIIRNYIHCALVRYAMDEREFIKNNYPICCFFKVKDYVFHSILTWQELLKLAEEGYKIVFIKDIECEPTEYNLSLIHISEPTRPY